MAEMLENDQITLVINLKKGDISAFQSIYNAYYKRIYNFCLKLLPSVDDAQEATQKVFIALWEQRDQIDETKSLTSYIFFIARYTAYHDFKNLVYHQAAFEYFASSQGAFPETARDELLFKELTNVLNNIIEQLPPQRRMIFRLSRFYNLTYKLIAKKLGISENTVDTQIRRALDHIRKEYNKYLK